MHARALCEGARYCDYIFRVRGERRNCPSFVFYDVRETLCPRHETVVIGRGNLGASAEDPPFCHSRRETFLVRRVGRGGQCENLRVPKWKRAPPLNYSSPWNIGYATSAPPCFDDANAVGVPRNVYLGFG